jgi:hypothetical protein
MHNCHILEANNFDLQKVIHADPLSPLQPGSEWRPVPLLDPIFHDHPFWPNVQSQFNHGLLWPLVPITEPDRLHLVMAGINYGNHRSAQQASSSLLPSLQAEVSKGWQLPLPIFTLHKIDGLVVAPLGYVNQFGLDTDTGLRVAKGRTTHDQSFNHNTDRHLSVNDRLLSDSLSPCEYGFTLSCHIHRVVALRAAFPEAPILQMKLDFKSAYRRQHLHGDTAKQCTVTTTGLEADPIGLLLLCQTFGGAAGPPCFSDISTIITDLGNALARLPSKTLDALPDSIYKDKIGSPTLAPSNIPIAPALPLRITPEADGHATANNYIDDIIAAFTMLAQSDPTRAAKALMLAFKIASRPC